MNINTELLSSIVEKIYNSCIILEHLNKLKDDQQNELSYLIKDAIDSNKQELEITIKTIPYKISIESQNTNNKWKVNLVQEQDPNANDNNHVKDPDYYKDVNNIISLWYSSKVFVQKDKNNNLAFSTNIETDSKQLQFGGLDKNKVAKKVPTALRSVFMHNVLKILNGKEQKDFYKKLRIENNAATGSGKTGDYALLALMSYMINLPCIIVVPNDNLKTQVKKFFKEFLPDEVTEKFEKSLSKNNLEYGIITSEELLENEWSKVNNRYFDFKTPALFCFDEVPLLKYNIKHLAKAADLSESNPIAVFSATPDPDIAKEMRIPLENQILISPQEKFNLGIGKLPTIYYEEINSKEIEEKYLDQLIKSHKLLIESKLSTVNEFNEKIIKLKTTQNYTIESLNESFLDYISKSINSAIYQPTLIAAEKNSIITHYYPHHIIYKDKNSEKYQEKQNTLRNSLCDFIKDLNTDLTADEINHLINSNINIELGAHSLPNIKLCKIIDTFNEYLKTKQPVNKEEVSQFIKDKYGITDYRSSKSEDGQIYDLNYNSDITNAILKINELYKQDQEYEHRINRNYPDDKRLHNEIFEYDNDIKNFCDQDVYCTHYDGKIELESLNDYKVTQAILDTKHAGFKEQNAIIMNMVRAGFIPVILSKELATGLNAPGLGNVAILVKGPSEILNPNYTTQVIGRVGRSKERPELPYVYMITSEPCTLDITQIPSLSSKDFLQKLNKSREEYFNNHEGISDAKSQELINKIPNYAKGKSNNELQLENCAYNGFADLIIAIFNNINVNFYYNKTKSIKIFTKVLQKTVSYTKNKTNDANQQHKKITPGSNEYYEKMLLDDIHNFNKVIEILNDYLNNPEKCLEEWLLEYNILTPDHAGNNSLKNLIKFVEYLVKIFSKENLKEILHEDSNKNSDPPVFINSNIELDNLSPEEKIIYHINQYKPTLDDFNELKEKIEEIEKNNNINFSYQNAITDNTLFHYAVKNTSLLEYLINKFTEQTKQKEQLKNIVNTKNKKGETALHLATLKIRGNNFTETIETLVKYGADINIKDNKDLTPLVHAIKNDNIDAIRSLLYKPEVDIKINIDKKYSNIFEYALSTQNTAIAEVFSDYYKANNNILEQSLINALFNNIKNTEFIQFLIEKYELSIDILQNFQKHIKSQRFNLLNYALNQGSFKTTQYFIEELNFLIDKNAINTVLNGNNKKEEKTKLVEYLIYKVIKPENNSFISTALTKGLPEIASILHDNKFYNTTNNNHQNESLFLQWAIEGGDENLSFLEKIHNLNSISRSSKDIDILTIKSDNYIPLHYAISKKCPKIAEFLITKKKADVNQTSHHLTPLHLAIRNTQKDDFISLLINNGANLDIKHEGKTPLELAIHNSNKEISILLIEETLKKNLDAAKPTIFRNSINPIQKAALAHWDFIYNIEKAIKEPNTENFEKEIVKIVKKVIDLNCALNYLISKYKEENNLKLKYTKIITELIKEILQKQKENKENQEYIHPNILKEIKEDPELKQILDNANTETKVEVSDDAQVNTTVIENIEQSKQSCINTQDTIYQKQKENQEGIHPNILKKIQEDPELKQIWDNANTEAKVEVSDDGAQINTTVIENIEQSKQSSIFGSIIGAIMGASVSIGIAVFIKNKLNNNIIAIIGLVTTCVVIGLALGALIPLAREKANTKLENPTIENTHENTQVL